jgi:P22_AR N-terminal domain
MDLVKINDVEISFPQQGETIFVPIKPICEVLGIDHSAQVQTLKNHPILGSVMVENPTTGSDGKTYQMLNLPLKYFFGWLFSIDARKVKPEASEAVIKYQEKVYDVIYDKFFLEPVQQKKKLILLLEKENQLLMLEGERKELNAQIKIVKQQIEEIKIAEPNQLELPLN